MRPQSGFMNSSMMFTFIIGAVLNTVISYTPAAITNEYIPENEVVVGLDFGVTPSSSNKGAKDPVRESSTVTGTPGNAIPKKSWPTPKYFITSAPGDLDRGNRLR